MVCNVARGFKRNRLTGHASFPAAHDKGVVKSAQEEPGEETNVGNTLKELLRALAGDGVRWVEKPGHVLCDFLLAPIRAEVGNLEG